MAVKSTSKAVKEKIQDYIIQCLSTDETTDLQSQLECVVKAFHNWYSPYEQKSTPNHAEAFAVFLMCLPSELSVDYYDYEMREHLIKWLGESDKTYTDSEVNTRYLWLIYREFAVLCKKHKVEFNRLADY